MRHAAALGCRAHTGWAALVVVAGGFTRPEVVLRGRAELGDPRGRVRRTSITRRVGWNQRRRPSSSTLPNESPPNSSPRGSRLRDRVEDASAAPSRRFARSQDLTRAPIEAKLGAG
jgi:hypothetical protein